MIEKNFITSGRNTIIHKNRKFDLLIINGDHPVIIVSNRGIGQYKGEIIDEDHYSADMADEDNYQAYRVLQLDSNILKYQHIITEEVFILRRVVDKVAHC